MCTSQVLPLKWSFRTDAVLSSMLIVPQSSYCALMLLLLIFNDCYFKNFFINSLSVRLFYYRFSVFFIKLLGFFILNIQKYCIFNKKSIEILHIFFRMLRWYADSGYFAVSVQCSTVNVVFNILILLVSVWLNLNSPFFGVLLWC